MLPLKHPRVWLVVGWSLVVIALTGFLMPPRDVELLGLHHLNDKFMHATAYTTLFLWFAGLYPRSRYVLIAFALLLMGITVEWLQGSMAMGRSRDVMDVLANASGIVIGIVLALSLLGGWAQRVEAWIKKS
jgi:VanZ family protein